MRSANEPNGRRELTFTERARRTQIVASAIDTIAELGYGSASLVKIAEHAGTSKGVVTYHFANKEELIAAVYEAAIAQAGQFIGPRLASVASGREMLRAYIESNLAFMRESPNLMVALVEIFANARGDDGSPLFGVERLDEIVAPLERWLTQYQEAGEFRDFDARSMAFAIRSAIDAVPPRLVRDPDFDSERYGAELATSFVLAATRVPDER